MERDYCVMTGGGIGTPDGGNCSRCGRQVESESQLCANPRPKYLSEVFRIVEGATRGDMDKVKAYGELLAEKLEADGEENSARWLRQILEGKAGAQIHPA